MMRCGFPPPPNLGNRPVTNIRNVASPYWRGWLKPGFRCLVPATSFCGYTDGQPKAPPLVRLGADRPLFAFAGICCLGQARRRGADRARAGRRSGALVRRRLGQPAQAADLIPVANPPSPLHPV
jgi:putative SOS response-associated peptidase YedK